MIKKIRLMILSLSYLFLMILPAAVAAPALAAPNDATTSIQNNLCTGSNLNFTANGSDCSSSNLGDPSGSVTNTIKKIINILSVIIGAIAVVMIIIGGFRYVTSGGNAEGTKAARQTIIYAIVGLVIVALAQIIVHFVLSSVSST